MKFARAEVADRHASNAKAERALQHRDLANGYHMWPKFAQKCEVHIISQSSCSATNICTDDISGAISTALSQQGSGVLRTLQALLADVLTEELQVVYDVPPETHQRLREECYDLYLPLSLDSVEAGAVAGGARVVQRRYILSRMLNGDISDDSCVWHFCQYNCCLDFDHTVQKMRDFVAWALCPGKTPRFARNRWVNQEPAIEWVGLISSHHSLLSKVMRRWVGRPSTATGAPDQEQAEEEPDQGEDGCVA